MIRDIFLLNRSPDFQSNYTEKLLTYFFLFIFYFYTRGLIKKSTKLCIVPIQWVYLDREKNPNKFIDIFGKLVNSHTHKIIPILNITKNQNVFTLNLVQIHYEFCLHSITKDKIYTPSYKVNIINKNSHFTFMWSIL